LIICFAALARVTGSLSMTGVFSGLVNSTWFLAGPALALIAIAILVVFLAENARIPVDDPNTHLELTMIHEVMILDYSGPDLAIVLYGASLKLWVLGTLIVNVLLSLLGLNDGLALIGFAAGMVLLAVLVGIIESVMARFRLLKVPQLLIGAGALAVLAFVLVVRFTS
jgi:formate hydrogenlyase subunit 4